MIDHKLHIGTNLKMYKTIKDTVSYLTDLERLTSDLSADLRLFVIPSYTALPAASAAVDHARIGLGAQNMHWEESGQFTGEISPLMLQELDLEIVEIGHSERRHVFRETDIEENKKVISAIRHGFTALLCVGETSEDKELTIGDERLRQQLKVGLHGLREAECKKLWVAYEPVWAIGVHGIPARSDYADAKHRMIRETLLQLFPQEGGNVPILYGGSVNPENACDLIHQPAIDGLFIGRSAWEASRFNTLIRQVLPVWQQKLAKGLPR
jgi:triosephosphate isomerase